MVDEKLMRIRIETVGLHWLDDLPASSDLCAHGGVRLEVNGSTLIDSGEADHAVSTGAVHLLRTLSTDHTPAHPIAEHLIPHCGHFMVVDEESGLTVNIGCATGVNWWVRHRGDRVDLTLPDGREITVDRTEWCRAVVDFSDAVRDFYESSAPKRPIDENDQVWYPVFQEEWSRLRASAICTRDKS